MSEEEVVPIFLNDGGILPWERPKAPDVMSMLWMYNGSTTVKECRGIENVDTTRGSYRIVASAVKYLADIARLPEDIYNRENFSESPTEPIERKVLFNGGIQIYVEGDILGTEVYGSELVTRGKIWSALDFPVENVSKDSQLYWLLSGCKDELPPERIRGIIAGYEMQNRSRERAEENRVYNAWGRGNRDGLAGWGPGGRQ